MNITDAATWKSRLLFRISTDPTASARTLRAVIELHGPEQNPDRVDAQCRVCTGGPGITVQYPCATPQVVARELGVPLPEPTGYEALTDG
jgi:hypothetical protein